MAELRTELFEEKQLMKHKNTPTDWKKIMVMVEGMEVTGSYRVDATDWMTVRMDGGGSKSARGGPAAEGVARIILHELAREN